MKHLLKIILMIVVILSITACKEKPRTPLDEYGNSLIDSYKRGQEAGEIANLDAVKKAVMAYYASNGKYPHNLEEIKDLLSSDVDLSHYSYNPENGKVTLKIK